jgi:hypothetical protein
MVQSQREVLKRWCGVTLAALPCGGTQLLAPAGQLHTFKVPPVCPNAIPNPSADAHPESGPVSSVPGERCQLRQNATTHIAHGRPPPPRTAALRCAAQCRPDPGQELVPAAQH